jgi:uncharacterized protein YbjT (DUF2867 family)
MILVAGSTGNLGGEVCRLLVEQGHSVRGLVRASSDPARIATLRDAGVDVVVGDLRQPSSLAAACDGVTAVISTASATTAAREGDSVINVDGAGQVALVDAARAAGVGHFVFVSFSGGVETDSPLRTSKRTVEQHLRESGMTWTVLRPSVFMEIWLSPLLGFDVPNRHTTIYGSGGAPISYISLYDVARFCLESLHNAAACNAVLELGGPEPITPLQAVRIAEEVTGAAIAATHVPVEALQAQYEAAQDPLQKSFAALMLAIAFGDSIDMRETLHSFPMQLRSVREFMQQTYGPFVVAPTA